MIAQKRKVRMFDKDGSMEDSAFEIQLLTQQVNCNLYAGLLDLRYSTRVI